MKRGYKELQRPKTQVLILNKHLQLMSEVSLLCPVVITTEINISKFQHLLIGPGIVRLGYVK